MSQKSIEYRCTRNGTLELVLYAEEPRNYPWHFHACHWTFGLVRSGMVRLATMRGDFSLTIGQIFVLAPLAPHRLTIHERSSLAVLCSDKPDFVLDNRLSNLARYRTSHKLPKDMEAWLSAPTARPDVTVHGPVPKHSSPVSAARSLLAARADEPFSLDDLANFAGCSPWYFLRSFKKEMGLTSHAFHLICRLGRARTMLRAGRAAAETAMSTGFTDQSHLHKFFKLHHGLTPRQFTKASIIMEH